jgi:hypothetical protein
MAEGALAPVSQLGLEWLCHRLRCEGERQEGMHPGGSLSQVAGCQGLSPGLRRTVVEESKAQWTAEGRFCLGG